MAGRFDRAGFVLSLSMLGTCALFHLAPIYPVGSAVCWWNAVTWAVLLVTLASGQSKSPDHAQP